MFKEFFSLKKLNPLQESIILSYLHKQAFIQLTFSNEKSNIKDKSRISITYYSLKLPIVSNIH